MEPPCNSLASAASAYLRSAAHQPVHWQPWGGEAFARAVAENKPVLLDIGAVWCHWCHVMDRESYDDPETAALINEYFVAIKVDRDERPDIDARYQAAVAAISGQGGWPLTAFLTPDGRPFFGGTYFPPEDRYGRPSLRRVLLTMASSFAVSPHDVEESAASVMEAIGQTENVTAVSGLGHPGAALALVNRLISGMLTQYDPVHGGFGSQPKFPHPGALRLLLDAASRPGPNAERAGNAALHTLRRMAAGGICDQLGGGFHRYSVDERWIVPHFEKMSYDNAELLQTYAQSVQTFADAECAAAARDTLRWMNTALADRMRGGFAHAQDADVSPIDDGSFYTWTRDEAAAALLPEEFRLAEVFYDIGPIGDMPHDPARNVLFRAFPMEEAAQRAGIEADAASALLQSVRSRLLAARQQRPEPFIDRTVYTAGNTLCISAWVAAGRALAQPAAVAFAEKSLHHVLNTAYRGGKLSHVVAYAGVESPEQAVPGFLDDYVFLGQACLDTWEATGEPRFFAAADSIAETLMREFHDSVDGGFFDTTKASMGVATGALRVRRKPFQDAPTPAGNPAAADLLMRLHALTGKAAYRDRAQETLEAFAGLVEHLGLNAATFGLALTRLAHPPLQVIIVGDGNAAAALELAALARYAVHKTVIRLHPSQVKDQAQHLPSALAETLPHLPTMKGAVALVCSGQACQPPATDVPSLLTALHNAEQG